MPIVKRWRGTGGSAVGIHCELGSARGLQKLGGSVNRQVRLAIGYANADVARIELINAQRSWTADVGIDGFCMGRHCPTLTTATAIAADGSVIPASEIVL